MEIKLMIRRFVLQIQVRTGNFTMLGSSNSTTSMLYSVLAQSIGNMFALEATIRVS